MNASAFSTQRIRHLISPGAQRASRQTRRCSPRLLNDSMAGSSPTSAFIRRPRAVALFRTISECNFCQAGAEFGPSVTDRSDPTMASVNACHPQASATWIEEAYNTIDRGDGFRKEKSDELRGYYTPQGCPKSSLGTFSLRVTALPGSRNQKRTE